MYTIVKRYASVICIALILGVGAPLCAQAQSDIVVQKKFLTTAINTFLQRANQMQGIIQKRTDIFTADIQDQLLDGANQSITAFTGYLNDAISAKTVDELRALAGDVYTYRTTEDAVLRQEILSAYFTYFEKTTQQLITARYQNVQDKIISAKNQGRDTISIEGTFSQATVALRNLQDTVAILHEALQNQQTQEGVILVSLDQTENGLKDIQKNISSIYGVFRKITIEGDVILELNKEEQKIQNTFPAW